ncbi:hypothetical protein [Isoptericola sp. NPDC057653]|uniref:hypothetical protein n=1 Tax=Isoptericola sp. NPDC057653 TaxID=3346195 RepID=UPI0036C6D29E
MIIRIQLLARLLRIRLLRVEGVVAISDDVRPEQPGAGTPLVDVRADRAAALGSGRPQVPVYGRDLAEAETLLAQVSPPERRSRESS